MFVLCQETHHRIVNRADLYVLFAICYGHDLLTVTKIEIQRIWDKVNPSRLDCGFKHQKRKCVANGLIAMFCRLMNRAELLAHRIGIHERMDHNQFVYIRQHAGDRLRKESRIDRPHEKRARASALRARKKVDQLYVSGPKCCLKLVDAADLFIVECAPHAQP